MEIPKGLEYEYEYAKRSTAERRIKFSHKSAMFMYA